MASQSDYLLNEDELNKLVDDKKTVYIYDWLRRLSKLLLVTQKEDIRDIQKTLVDQLMKQMNKINGHPTRKLIAVCLSKLFTIGDTFLLFDTINKCIEILKIKDDSNLGLSAKLSSIVCIGIMYENLGRLTGRTYEETVQLLLKFLKNADSQARYEIYSTLKMIISGMGTAASSIYRDIYKSLKHGMVDRSMPVRSNAARCLLKLIEFSPFLYTIEIENVFSLCFRALDGSNYEVRCAVAETLGFLVATTQNPTMKQNLQIYHSSTNTSNKIRIVNTDEALNLLASGYLRGGIGFLKAGEMIKGSSTANREIRIGVSHAYVSFAMQVGCNWIEKNITFFMTHLFEILTNPKACSTHMEAIHSRRCIGFILRVMIGKVMTEKVQFQALKELVKFIVQYSKIGHSGVPRAANAKNFDLINPIEDSSVLSTNDVQMAQHVLVVSLLELGTLINQLGASSLSILNDNQIGLIESICFVINHPTHVVRLSSAWCLRCISSSINGQLTPLFERSLERLETLRSTPESVNGHSYVLSALLGTVRYTPLGIPQNKAKLIFNIAEDLLRTASQNSRLSMPRTQAGWQLMGAVMTLGHSFVKNLLPRLMLLWKNSFPRNTKDLESEKARGDAFTWQITLENRAGALAAIASFLNCCPKLVTDDIRRRLLTPIESAITMLVSLNSLFKTLGPAIKASYTMVRLRLYQVLLLLPPQLYENCFSNLLRLLVSDLTLSENVANTTSSLLRNLIQTNSDIILGSWIQETEHSLIEDQMEPNRKLDKDFIQSYISSGVGSIEYDPTILYKATNEFAYPSPLPLAVAIIDKAALVFALAFPYVAQKHRVQMLNYFQECIKHAKSSRQVAIQINIITAILGALKTLAESKMNLGTDEVRKLVVSHIFSTLNNPNPLIRYASAESLGRCVQTINDARFLSEITHQCFEKLRTARDALTRTSYSLAIGSIHHFVVGMGSVQQLKTNISLLLALAEDHSSPSVQIWALHALTLISESGGPMFRSYVEPTLNQCLKILLALPPSLIDVYQSIGKCLSAMITTIGPEFQSSSHIINEIRLSILIACSVLQEHGDFLVNSETIGCLQQLHMFDRKNFNLSELIFFLCDSFLSTHYLLRKASISCLHQIAQKESKPLIRFGSEWVNNQKSNVSVGIIPNFNIRATNRFPSILTALLDFENDSHNISNVKKILNCLIQNIDEDNLSMWLSLCKDVLSASDNSLNEPNEVEHDHDDGDFEESGFKTKEDVSQVKISYRWQTRVFIMRILSKIITTCSQSSINSNVHFDLTLARERNTQSNGKQDFLVLHLSDLVRMSFMGATSECDDLRMEGLKTLELIIEKFSQVPEPEFPNHVILEQFQAQVGAALRPAFAVDTASHVTAMACQVCSAWIGSGVARDLNDLRRVHQLLVSSLDKLHKNSTSRIYNESASTMEKLAILKAWAEVYVVAMVQNDKQMQQERPEVHKENLLHLVTPELLMLSKYWIFALKDHALLTLPNEYINQIPLDGGTFFITETTEIVRPMYRSSWPSILNAAALWLCSGKGFEILEKDETMKISKYDQFYLLFGICMEALSNPKSTEQSSHVSTYLESLKELITNNEVTKSILMNNTQLILELCQVLHRLLLTHEVSDCQIVITEIVKSLIEIHSQHLLDEKRKLMEDAASDQQADGDDGEGKQDQINALGEGGFSGEIEVHNSIVYSLLEICLSILVRQLPQLCPILANTPEFTFIRSQKTANYLLFNADNAKLIGNVLNILCDLPSLCSPRGSLTILPTILYLLTGVFCELSVVSQTIYDEKLYEKEPILTFLKCIKSLCNSQLIQFKDIRVQWIQLLQTSVARILDISKTSNGEQKQDFVSTLLAIGVFAIYSPTEVLGNPQLQYPIINLMTQALQSENDLIQLKCIETLKLMFSQSEHNSVFYMQSLAPKMIEVFYTLLNNVRVGQCLSNDKVNSILNILACMEVFIEKAKEDKKLDMLYIYIPALISLLNIETQQDIVPSTRLMSISSAHKVTLHDHSLQKLTEIGLKYSEEFKQIMSSSPSYSESLKSAIHNQQKKANNGNDISKTAANRTSSMANENQSIKLKVDFSNYK